jgi:hypothetical protein
MKKPTTDELALQAFGFTDEKNQLTQKGVFLVVAVGMGVARYAIERVIAIARGNVAPHPQNAPTGELEAKNDKEDGDE